MLPEINEVLPAPYGTARTFNATNDALFKYIFGKEERKAITIDFLNTFLATEFDEPITDLSFTQTEMSPECYRDKEARFDVACQLWNGTKVDIEMQVVNNKDMDRRSIYYWADLFRKGFKIGSDYRELKPAITICILDYEMFSDEVAPSPFSSWFISHSVTHARFSNHLGLHFLEIPKFDRLKKNISEFSKMERWMCYFSSKLSFAEKEAIVNEEPEIMTALTATNNFFQSEAERQHYIDREIVRMDMKSALRSEREEGWAEGMAKGMAKGIAKGEAQERFGIISALLKSMTPEDIAARLDWDVDTVKNVARKGGSMT